MEQNTTYAKDTKTNTGEQQTQRATKYTYLYLFFTKIKQEAK